MTLNPDFPTIRSFRSILGEVRFLFLEDAYSSIRIRLRDSKVAMIQMHIDEIKAGMVLARSLIKENGDLLLASGFVITARVLAKLKEIGLSSCYVYEEGTEFVVPEEMISEQLANQTQGILRDNAEALKTALKTQEITQDNLNAALKDKSRFKNIVAVDRMKDAAQEIINSLMGSEPVIVNVSSIRTKSGYVFQHALDVAVTAIMVGARMGYSMKELEELAMGCLLMDLGMVMISDSIVYKTQPLTESERNLLREHTTLGYAVLRENNKIALTTAHIAYQHHERQDGMGFPRGLTGDNTLPHKRITGERNLMHRYAEIAAVADTYVGLLSPRPGTGTIRNPDEVMKILIMAAGTHLNKSIVDSLITMIPIYPVGSRIVVVEDRKFGRLTGCTGIVAKTSMDAPEQPEIVVLYDRDKNKMNPVVVNLVEEPEFKIQFAKLH